VRRVGCTCLYGIGNLHGDLKCERETATHREDQLSLSRRARGLCALVADDIDRKRWSIGCRSSGVYVLDGEVRAIVFVCFLVLPLPGTTHQKEVLFAVGLVIWIIMRRWG
jgi:hypothetical protein